MRQTDGGPAAVVEAGGVRPGMIAGEEFPFTVKIQRLAQRRGLLRNVGVALGNVGDETALPALEKATKDHEPLIAEHARWAMSVIRTKGR